jgi:hypothetical protein
MAKVRGMHYASTAFFPPLSFLSFSLLGWDVSKQQRRVHSERLGTIYGYQHPSYGILLKHSLINIAQDHSSGDFFFN